MIRNQYVNATNCGDDLLWRFIIQGTDSIKNIKRGREIKLNCQSLDLDSDDFLENRLKSSGQLFGLAVEYMLQFSSDYNPLHGHNYYENVLLDDTSHQPRDSTERESIHIFLKAVEVSMKYRSAANDEEWRRYEPRLRVSRELGVRYLTCEAYASNINDNIEGISYQITDKELLRYENLEYELGKLTSSAYPQIDLKVQEKNQEIIRHLYDDLDIQKHSWIEKKTYELLSYIQLIYRLEEVADFCKVCEKKYGYHSGQPRITCRSGIVVSPISGEQLINLTDDSLIKIFHYYEGSRQRNDVLTDSLSIDRMSLVSELISATSLRPDRFITLIPSILAESLSADYLFAIIRGVALHLSYRFSNSSNSNCKPVEPLPDVAVLASTLLRLIENYSGPLEEHSCTLARATDACAHVLRDAKSVDRIAFQLWLLSSAACPDPLKDDETHDLINSGINSTRSIAADTLMMICNDLLEKGKSLNTDLTRLLYRYASDSSMVVRALILRRLPYFIGQESVIGWRLVELLLTNAKPRLSKHFEQTLYYQSRTNFSLASPYINNLKNIDDDETGATWGRLAALCYLYDHISLEDLWDGINDRNPKQLEGVGQVFVANLDSQKSSDKCVNGLSVLIQSGVSNFVFELALSNKKKLRYVPLSLIQQFISNADVSSVSKVNGVFKWFEKYVSAKPHEVLIMLEALIERLKTIDQPINFDRSDALVTTIKLLLQEADSLGDVSFIDRVLVVQGWFCENGASDLEHLLN